MAKRILGMGDVVGIIEQAQQMADEEQMEAAERMLREGFTMDDMLDQMRQIRKMGGLTKLIGMIPNGERMLAQSGGALDDSQLTRIEAIIHSMTKDERSRPKTINGQRRKRIAAGSGRSVQEVNALLKQWGEMNKMMGKMRAATKGGKNERRQMRQMMQSLGIDGKGSGLPF
jgi:signal recognition particle subunit SRP54